MGLVVGLAFIGAGLISIAAVIQQAHDGSASLQWPTAVGVVEQASLDRGWTRGGERTYSPHIVYRYAVMGREYSSDQITVGSSGTPGQARPAGSLRRAYWRSTLSVLPYLFTTTRERRPGLYWNRGQYVATVGRSDWPSVC